MSTLAEMTTNLTLDRKQLAAALDRVKSVIPSRTAKPILQGVRLHAADGELQLAATDLDVSVVVCVPVEADLPVCVVPCGELVRRVKSGRSVECRLQLNVETDTLSINGGCAEHRIRTLDRAEFPVIADKSGGTPVHVEAEELKQALATVLVATARDATRYALDSVLLESDETGVRWVATDGRRMVIRELANVDAAFRGKALLPRRFVDLAKKLIDAKHDEVVAAFVQRNAEPEDHPAGLFIAGPDWMLSSKEPESRFPEYWNVVPKGGSRIIDDRKQLLTTLDEVALATSLDNSSVRVKLMSDAIEMSAKSAELGESSGSVHAAFAGGGDDRIVTAFDPRYLRDAVRTLQGDRIVIDVQQNKLCKTSNTVMGHPALLYDADSPRTWSVVMPVTLEVPSMRPAS